MPDSHPTPSPPADWAQAFMALPVEAPPTRDWEALAARLDARHRARWPAWLALAAALALVALLPLRQWLHGNAPPSPGTHLATARAAPGPVSRTTPSDPATATVAASPSNAIAGAMAPDGGQAASDVATPAAISPRAPATAVAKTTAHRKREPNGTQASGIASHALEPLYAESARLESLLALARDDHVSSGSAALVAGALDAQVATIDAALADPALGHAQRLQLWRERVDALRQAAGFESTQRLLAAHGHNDTLLVSID